MKLGIADRRHRAVAAGAREELMALTERGVALAAGGLGASDEVAGARGR